MGSRNFAFLLYILFITRTNADVIEPCDIVIVILSQKEHHHIDLANYLRERIYDQADILRKESPRIVLSHQLNIKGSWTITPLLPYLSNNFPGAKWFFFCVENIVIRLKKLLDVFGKFNASEDVWIGNALFDQHPTIIHHFARSNIYKYPHIVTGFGMTFNLLNSLSQQISEGKGPKMDFSIDAPYEFARFVLKSTGVELTHMSEICIASASYCATYPRFFDSCSSFISSRSVYFAVKTCAKYHIDRIPVIKNSWAKYKIHIGYFSDAADKNLREAYIVPNTTEGHCAKTYGILQRANIIMKKFKHDWLVISDDDTLFNIARLLYLLTCYNPKRLIAIGERYGFRMWDRYQGYEYLTGGAGIVLSAPLVREMLRPGVCDCPSATTPDDMYLFGHCLSRLEVQPVHSLMFHQARPADYPVAYLVSQNPISFHKFWMIDPLKDIYDRWLAPKHKILIRIIAKAMNFKADYYMPFNIAGDKWGKVGENDSYTGLLGEAIIGNADFFLGDLHYTIHNLKYFDLSTPYNTECLTFLTPESLTDNSWKLLILPFRQNAWIALLCTLLISGGSLHVFALFYQKYIGSYLKRDETNSYDNMKGLYLFTEFQNSMLYTYGMLLQVSLPRLPNTWTVRIFIGWWWIYSILVAVIYRASMTATLSHPVAMYSISE